MLVPGIWEEIAFRGVILTLLLKKYSEKKSIIINGLLFGGVHFINIIQGADVVSTIIQMVYG
jgi:membrane protease YdiL (CAAX protease family)